MLDFFTTVLIFGDVVARGSEEERALGKKTMIKEYIILNINILFKNNRIELQPTFDR